VVFRFYDTLIWASIYCFEGCNWEAKSYSWSRWIKGGATMTGGRGGGTYVFGISSTLYPTFEVLIAKQEMMVDAASTVSMRSPVEHKIPDQDLSTRVYITSKLIKCGGSKLGFGDEKQIVDLWSDAIGTHAVFSFFKAYPRSRVIFVCYCLLP
jgi:hypothetical protein